MKTIVYEKDTLVQGCYIAIRNHLYVGGWTLYGELKETALWPKNERLAIAYNDSTPIAVVLQRDSFRYKFHVSAFTRSRERRKGYATACYRALGISGAHAYNGINGSENFWAKLNIPSENAF